MNDIKNEVRYIKRVHKPEIFKRLIQLMGDSDTLQKSSDKTGLSVAIIHRAKSGKSKCSIEVMESIMAGYNITWKNLIYGLYDPKRKKDDC